MTQRGQLDAVAMTEELEPLAHEMGCLIEAIDIVGKGEGLTLRVVIDLSDDASGSIDLDTLADATRAISSHLDSIDTGDAPFLLEVTSPGSDLPLTLPRHFRRNLGRLVDVTLATGETIAGRVASVDDGSVTLTVTLGKNKTGTEVVKFDMMNSGKVVFELNPPRSASPDENESENA